MKIQKLLCIIFLSLLCGCEGSNKQDELIIGTSADNPPYEFISGGKVVGLDIDIIEAIGHRLGKKIVIKNLDLHGLLAALTSKNVDLVIAALSITKERQAKVDFSIPYTSGTIAVLYRKDSGFKDLNDLQEKYIGAQFGTTWEQIAQDLSKKLNLRVHSLSNNLMLVEELKSKVIDAIIFEEAQTEKFIANNPELASFSLRQFSSEFAIALPKGSDLTNNINEAIKALNEDGTLDNIRKKWLK